MTATTFAGHFLGPGTHASRPAASGLPEGTMYVCTTDSKIERVVSGAWADYATLGSTETLAASIIDAKGDLIAGTANDTPARLAVGSDGQVLTADAASTPGVKWATPAAGGGGAWTLLSTTTLSSSGAFDVSSISGSYNDLILVAMIRETTSAPTAGVYLRFNGDTGSNYFREALQVTGSGTSMTSIQSTAATLLTLGDVAAATAPSGHFTAVEAIIPGYASTTWRKALSWTTVTCSSTSSGGMWLFRGNGFWNSTAAINRVQFVPDASLLTGSQLRIYGRT